MKKQPQVRIRAGQCEAALWENEVKMASGETINVLKANVERRYKNAQGEWASTNSYGRADIPLVIFCLQRAYAEIIDRDNERAARNRERSRDRYDD